MTIEQTITFHSFEIYQHRALSVQPPRAPNATCPVVTGRLSPSAPMEPGPPQCWANCFLADGPRVSPSLSNFAPKKSSCSEVSSCQVSQPIKPPPLCSRLPASDRRVGPDVTHVSAGTCVGGGQVEAPRSWTAWVLSAEQVTCDLLP